ncbi:alpha/beta-hydrolase N-terminal domain-containing protein, partial [Rhodococcus aetherivorans]
MTPQGTGAQDDSAPSAPDTATTGAGLPGSGHRTATVEAAAGDDESRSPETVGRRKLLYVTLPGCWGALIFACLSFTPSLLPRGGLLQGLICGITAAIGYGLGVFAAFVWRAFADRGPRRP